MENRTNQIPFFERWEKTRFTTRAICFGALCATFCLCTSARAAFESYIADDALATGGGDTIVTDQGVGDNFPGSATVGQINSGAIPIGGFTTVSEVAQSKPLIGSAPAPQLDLTFSAVTTDNLSHTIYLYISEHGLHAAGRHGHAYAGRHPAGDPRQLGRRQRVRRELKHESHLSHVLAQVGPTSTSPFALSASDPLAPSVNPYSLTIGIAITRTTAGTTSGSLNLTAVVPEPSSLALLAVGGVGMLRRRSH